jgi:hypothetical protein
VCVPSSPLLRAGFHTDSPDFLVLINGAENCFTRAALEALTDLFAKFDADGDQHLSRAELGELLKA